MRPKCIEDRRAPRQSPLRPGVGEHSLIETGSVGDTDAIAVIDQSCPVCGRRVHRRVPDVAESEYDFRRTAAVAPGLRAIWWTASDLGARQSEPYAAFGERSHETAQIRQHRAVPHQRAWATEHGEAHEHDLMSVLRFQARWSLREFRWFKVWEPQFPEPTDQHRRTPLGPLYASKLCSAQDQVGSVVLFFFFIPFMLQVSALSARRKFECAADGK